MASKPTGVWGIDLGQCALKALRVEEVEGRLTATAFDYVEHPKILNQPDADPDQLMREALEKFLSRNALRGDVVAISVPSQSGLARFVKLPPVEEKKIQDIVRFEAKQQIPFNLDEVVWDYQKLGSGVVTDGFAMETEIGLFAMKRDKVVSYLDHFKEVKVDVHVVQMAPLALCNFVSYDLLEAAEEGGAKPAGKRRCLVALDIGTDSSNLVITDGNRIIWQRPIPLGGNHFTRALTKEPFKLTFAKAEHLKRNATKSGPELKKILTALKPVLNDFVGEVQRSLGYFTNTHRDAQVEYMVGLGNAFRLPGLQRFLGEKLQLEVRKLQKLERVAGDSVLQAPAFTENVLSFAVAYGLALQGISKARLQTNLLPPEIRMQRLIKAKKPWAAAAAAALLLGLGGLTFGKGLSVASYNPKNPKLEAAKKKSDAVVQKQKTGVDKVKETRDRVDAVENEVKGLSAGEQVDWILLNKFVSECLPRAKFNDKGECEGVSPLPEGARKAYWTRDAKEAHQYLRRVHVDGKTLAEVELDFLRFYKHKSLSDTNKQKPNREDYLESNLLQVSVEALDSRYTGDLKAFWEKVTKENQDRQLQPNEDVRGAMFGDANAPEGAGWVVELRGYTYHDNQTKFIRDVLLENLAQKAGLKKSAAKPAEGGAAEGAANGGEKAEAKSAAGKAEHPLRGKISHIIFVRSTFDQENLGDPGLSAYSLLPKYVSEAPPAGGSSEKPDAGGTAERTAPSPDGVPGPGGEQRAAGGAQGGKPRDVWRPLGGLASGGYDPTRTLFPGGDQERGGKTPSPDGVPIPSKTPVPSPDGVPSPDTKTGGDFPPNGKKEPPKEKKFDKTLLTRTDFVIFIVWKEPVPSEKQIWPKDDKTETVEPSAGGYPSPYGPGGPTPDGERERRGRYGEPVPGRP